MADVTTALVTAMNTVASGALDAIGGILPVAAPVMGAMLIIGVGIKAFKRFTGR